MHTAFPSYAFFHLINRYITTFIPTFISTPTSIFIAIQSPDSSEDVKHPHSEIGAPSTIEKLHHYHQTHQPFSVSPTSFEMPCNTASPTVSTTPTPTPNLADDLIRHTGMSALSAENLLAECTPSGDVEAAIILARFWGVLSQHEVAVARLKFRFNFSTEVAERLITFTGVEGNDVCDIARELLATYRLRHSTLVPTAEAFVPSSTFALSPTAESFIPRATADPFIPVALASSPTLSAETPAFVPAAARENGPATRRSSLSAEALEFVPGAKSIHWGDPWGQFSWLDILTVW